MEEPSRKRRRMRRRCKKHPKEGPHSPNCRGRSTNIQTSLVRVLPTLKPILNFLNINDEVFTRQQIMAHLTEYIKQKSLFDPEDPRKVYCHNDQLAIIFGCSEFSTTNACELLLQNLESLPDSYPPTYNSRRTVSTTDTCSCSETDQQGEPSSRYYLPITETAGTTAKNIPVGSKRSYDGSCSDTTNNTEQHTCGIYFSPLHKNFHSDDSGEYSRHHRKVCDNTTDIVTDTSDDLFFLDESDDEEFILSVTDEESFTEYEPITFSEEEHLEALTRQFEGEAETDVDEESQSSSTVIDEGDDGGDELGNESDNDSEIEEDDKWKCESCSERNHPMTRNCRKCWKVRKDWYPSSLERSQSDPGPIRKNLLKKEETTGNGKYLLGTGSDTASTSHNITQTDNDDNDNKEIGKCILCLKEPRNGCIIHGQTGHQVCCVACASKLKESGRKCPVCRKKIHKVIMNFT